MAQTSFAWTTNNTGDGPTGGYSAAVFQQFVRRSMQTDPATEAVLRGLLNELAVTAGSGLVAVASGCGLVYGVWYQNDASLNVSIPTPASATRRDRIILRANLTGSAHADTQPGQTVRIARLAGVEGSGSAPTVTQNASYWEVPLATVVVTTGGAITVTDERVYVASPGSSLPIKRQGGSASDWSASGANNYSPAAVKVQMGVVDVTFSNSQQSSVATVTFPVAFASTPFLMTSSSNVLTSMYRNIVAQSLSSTGVQLSMNVGTSVVSATHQIQWIAFGP